MTSKQIRHLTMYQIMRDCNTTNTVALAAIPGWTTAITAFNANTSTIEAKHIIETGTTSGATGDKKSRKDTLVSLLENPKNVLVAYAINTNNNTLHDAVNVIITSFVGDSVLVARANIIRDAANTNLASLSGYPNAPSAASITALTTAITDFSSFINRPAETEDTLKEARLFIKQAITDNGVIMSKKLKKLIKTVKVSNPALFVAVMDASKIEAASSTPISLRGKVVNQVGDPVAGAVLTIVENPQTAISTALGNYQFDSIPQGHYNITVTSPGYLPLTTQADITNGIGSTLDIVLTPIPAPVDPS